MTQVLDIYDSEMKEILRVGEELRKRTGLMRNYNDFEREIKERFEDIGFVVNVNWHHYAMNKVVQVGSAMPEVTIVGRVEQIVFDPDRQVHEVRANVLDLPPEDAEIIRTDDGEAFRRFRAGEAGHGHGHSHSH